MNFVNRLYFKLSMSWFLLFILVVLFRIFGYSFDIFITYVILNWALYGGVFVKQCINLDKYLKNNFGTWDAFSKQIIDTYALKKTPTKYNKLKFVWYAFSKYDFSVAQLKYLKNRVKFSFVFLLCLFCSFIPSAFIFMR